LLSPSKVRTTMRMHSAWTMTTALLLASCASGWAQRTPAPAASSGPISAIGAGKGDSEASPATEQPAEQQSMSELSASSVKLPTLGGRPQLLSYGLRVMEVASSNTAQVGGGGNSLQSITMISGNTGLSRNWGRSSLDLNYNGAESVFAGGGFGTQVTSTHQLTFNTSLARQRWSLGLSNAASYAPQSSFGLGLYGGLGSNPLGFASGLRSGLYPNESVLNSGSRINDSTVAQVRYQLSQRSSLDVSGGYGILRFQGAGLADSSQYNFGFGVDRTLSRRSNVSLSYTFFRTMSAGFPAVQAHSALVGYSRRLTPRLMMQLSAGPQFQVQPGSGLGSSVQWTTSNTLLYQMQRSSLTVTYSAGVIGGSGVYGASRNHTVQAALSRPVARFWAATVDVGYAQNAGVDAFSTIRAEHGGIMLGRQVAGKGLSLSYQFQHQAIGGTCSGLACSAFGGWSHTVGLGLDWLFRPLRIG
jgi:hypothetical protein